ncbi:MAG: Glutamate-tRNA ligase [Candidatus Azambacteria bacterium GW2011_GWE1_42_9]|nr:MAG: Glutamate-tRNA ligase [Candidatus Azambacteria bacterium GW2011_GWE1_42_9]
MNQKIITRFPPSPTGNFHVGSARTALFNFLFARKNNGKFILRIEDTDKTRSKKEFEDNIFESLEWLGLKYDEFYRQSDRGKIHRTYIEKMLDDGSIYEAEDKIIRFKNPNKKVKFNDLVRGEIEFDTTELKDFIIAKSVDEPLYHLAVVIDDFESNITHVIRGEDHISNTPRQILIQETISAPRPIYAHLPLILAPDRSKLSKRKHGESVSLDYYRNKGYSPEAMINYLALLGWNPGTEQEIFTLPELINVFDFSRVHKGGAIFDEKKLAWVNRKHFNLGKTRDK